MNSSRLVSIVIPAYKATFFEAALKSALRQNYDNIEIVVSDDCPTDAVAQIVEQYRVGSRFPIRYHHNPTSLGEEGNVHLGVSLALGEYIKFLYDDDVLVPDCVRILVDTLETTPGVSLVSSRRRRIDAHGVFKADSQATAFPFARDVVLNGRDVVSFLGHYIVNFIGEPSCVLCRRADLVAMGPGAIFALLGRSIHHVGDLAIYVKLLRQGDLALLARPLSYFRVSDEQFSQEGRSDPEIPRAWHRIFCDTLAQMGWVRPSHLNAFVRGRVLGGNGAPFNADLLACYSNTPSPQHAADPVHAWLEQRALAPAAAQAIQARLAGAARPLALLVVVSDLNDDHQAVMDSLASLGDESLEATGLQVVVLTSRAELPPSQPDIGLYWRAAGMGNEVEVLNQVIEQHDFQWMLRIDAGTQLDINGALAFADQLLDDQQCRAVYADELEVDGAGTLELAKRPDFNLDLLLSYPQPMARHWLIRREVLTALGGYDPQFPLARDLDLVLRLIESGGMQGIGHIDEPLLRVSSATRSAPEEEIPLLTRHLQRRGYEQPRIDGGDGGRYSLHYGHSLPSCVALLIDASGALPALQECLEQLLQTVDDVPVLVHLLAGGNETEQWLVAVEALDNPRIRVERAPHGTSMMDHIVAVAQVSQAPWMMFLQPGSQPQERGWLQHLLNHAQRPEVGAVTAVTPLTVEQARQVAIDDLPMLLRGVGLDHNVQALPESFWMMERLQWLQLAAQASSVGDVADRLLAMGRLLVAAGQVKLPPAAQ